MVVQRFKREIRNFYRKMSHPTTTCAACHIARTHILYRVASTGLFHRRPIFRMPVGNGLRAVPPTPLFHRRRPIYPHTRRERPPCRSAHCRRFTTAARYILVPVGNGQCAVPPTVNISPPTPMSPRTCRERPLCRSAYAAASTTTATGTFHRTRPRAVPPTLILS